MDSLTHIVLGAATGEAILGKKVGSKALVWGAIAGSVPDFDVAVTWLFDPVKALFVHRGFSHSIFFAVLAAPILGWIISKIHRDATFHQWTFMSLVAILIHSTIDCFNTYGTALLEPFSNARLALDSIGIIDFTLLVPLAIFVLAILFFKRGNKIRQLISYAALIFTMIFVGLTVANKLHLEHNVKKQLAEQNIQYTRLKTAPLPITNLLWLVLAEDSVGYHYGYISNFDKKKIDFKYINRDEAELKDLKNNKEIQELIRFTDGFYAVKRDSEFLVWLYDLRFGSMAFDEEGEWYVFSFGIEGDSENLTISRSHPDRKFNSKTFANYWERVFRDI